jgi:peptide deformylase
MKKSVILLLIVTFFSVWPCYATSEFSDKSNKEKQVLPNEKTAMHLVTIEMPDHTVLRKSAQTVSFPINLETRKFIRNFQAFFADLKSPLGKPAGLAAPQVGYPLRIIIIQISPEAKEKRKDVYTTLPPTLLINPSYTPVLAAGQSRDWEGCFSVPNKMGEVYRYNEIHYEAYTLQGEKISAEAKGFLARLLQHEIGHLNGQLYIDHLSAHSRYVSITEALKIIAAEKSTSLLQGH